MADRKKTPDLLASVLNEPVLLGEDEVKAVVKVEEAKAKPQKKSLNPRPPQNPRQRPSPPRPPRPSLRRPFPRPLGNTWKSPSGNTTAGGPG